MRLQQCEKMRYFGIMNKKEMIKHLHLYIYRAIVKDRKHEREKMKRSTTLANGWISFSVVIIHLQMLESTSSTTTATTATTATDNKDQQQPQHPYDALQNVSVYICRHTGIVHSFVPLLLLSLILFCRLFFVLNVHFAFVCYVIWFSWKN